MHLAHREHDSRAPDVNQLDAGQLDARQIAAEAAGHLQLLIELVDTISDRIFLINDQGKVTFVNGAFLNAYGLTSDQVLGKSPEEILPPEVFSACQKAERVAVDQGAATRMETNWIDPQSGTRCWTETHQYPMHDTSGRFTGTVGISRDITARRQAEEELKRSETLLLHASRLSSMGELAAGIAHEVNQPLFSILNYAKAIENKLQNEGPLDVEAIRNWVQQINREAARGGKITQRLKSFVKPTETHRKPSKINKIVLESIEFMTRESHDSKVTIATELAGGLPDVHVDQIQIQQVLVNLLKNAIEACVDHSTANPRVVVSTQQTTSGVEIRVADNGPGISDSEETCILDPFQTTKHDGIGLGLAISNTIVKAHQSELTYHSNDWGGATFCFSFLAAS